MYFPLMDNIPKPKQKCHCWEVFLSIINSVSSGCWVLPLPGARVPHRAGRSRGGGGRSACLHAGKWARAVGKGSGEQAVHPWIPAAVPEGQ